MCSSKSDKKTQTLLFIVFEISPIFFYLYLLIKSILFVLFFISINKIFMTIFPRLCFYLLILTPLATINKVILVNNYFYH